MNSVLSRTGVHPKVQSDVISHVNGAGGQRDGDYEGQVQGDVRGFGLRQLVVIRAQSEANAGVPLSNISFCLNLKSSRIEQCRPVIMASDQFSRRIKGKQINNS